MTSPLTHPAHRPVRVLLDVVLRAGGLVACAAVVPSLSGETDALASGLTMFFTLAGIAFVAALLDGMFQRDRLRLYLVWVVVVPVVGLVETAIYLRMLLTGPGAYPSLQYVSPGDIGETYLLYAALVGLPAVVGIVLGVLIRPLPAAPAAPVRVGR